ncbi:MAG: M14 family zinc carboxypeptidase [bacterium]
MKTSRMVFPVILLVFLMTPFCFATPLIEVSAPDPVQAAILQRMGLDIVSWRGNTVQVVGWDNDLLRLREFGIDYKVLEENLEQQIRKTVRETRRASRLEKTSAAEWTLGLFPGFSDLVAWRDALAQKYPALVMVQDSLGTTIEGVPIWAFKISDNPNQDEAEPEIFLNGAIHAREVITPLLLMAFADTLLSRYDRGDGRSVELVDSREIWILPLINIDGYRYNEENITDGDISNSGTTLWRKNRRNNGDDTFGVDLNRNFPFMWGLDDLGSSPVTNYPTYRGTGPASEPETQAIIEFINAHEFSGVLNYHSFSNLVLHPWGYTYDPHPDFDIYHLFGDYLNETLGWMVGGAEVIYITNGDASDWQAAGGMTDGANYPMWSFTFEVGDWEHDNGFWPNTMEIRDRLVRGQIEPIMKFCEEAPDPAPLAPPPAPLITQQSIFSDSLVLTWDSNGDNYGNVSQTYQVMEYSRITGGDDAETDSVTYWTQREFTRGNFLGDNGSSVWFSGDRSNMQASLTSTFPLPVTPANSVLSFQTAYSIEKDWDFAYVQVSRDGVRFENLANTRTNGYGGITDHSNGWITMEFSLIDYMGESIYLRFLYVSDTSINKGGWYIDDINAVIGYAAATLIADALSDTMLSIPLPESESYAFRVRGVDAESDTSLWSQPVYGGNFEVSAPAQPVAALPRHITLDPVYPNPFNSTARVSFELFSPSTIHLRVVDVLGRSLLDRSLGSLPTGRHQLALDGKAWSSGLIFIQISGYNQDSGMRFRHVQKAVLLR